MLIAFPVVPLPDDTTRVTVAVSEPCVPVPVIVSVKPPVGVLLAVTTVSVELLPALIDVGLNVPVAFAGRPVTPTAIVSVDPPTAVVFTAYAVLPPTVTVCEPGLTASVNQPSQPELPSLSESANRSSPL